MRGAIANGTPRAVADRIWAAAVKSCKKQYASVPNSIGVAQVQVPEGCRLVGETAFTSDRAIVAAAAKRYTGTRYTMPKQ